MHRYIRYIALVLLLLFCRAMVPDALIQELHPHTHTVHTDEMDSHKAQIGMKHKHCQVEDVFNSPCQGTALATDFSQPAPAAVHATVHTYSQQHSTSALYYLRGPPLA